MKKKIASMIINATKEYSIGEEDVVSRDNETKGIVKTIDRRRLTREEESAKSVARLSNITLH